MKLPSFALPERVGWRDHVVGAAFALLYVTLLLATARTVGFTRDETFYFRAASSYADWWLNVFERGSNAFSQGPIDRAFGDNHEHPALMKTLFGLSHWALHERLHVFSDASTAYRFPAMCTAGGAIWITYLFGARAYGRVAGAVAAVLLGAMPRVFFHSHLACFDVPIMSMWLACVYAHRRAQERGGLGWAIAAGVLFGLALETKHNAWELPVALAPHALFVHRHAFRRALLAGRISIPASLVSMAVIGPAVFLALWPYLWNDTLARLEWYVDFHLNHVYYNIEYLGHNVFEPPAPKSYLPVMVIATVPSITLALFLVGATDRARAGALRLHGWAMARLHRPASPVPTVERAETDLLLALSLLVAVGPFFLPRTPIFGGTKHWLPAYPALALFAGRGFQQVLGAMRRALANLEPRRMRAAEVALVLCVVIAPVAVTAHSNPFGLSAYVPLVGGTAGGADLGLNRQFWGFTSQNAAEEYLNAKAPPGAPVFIHDTTYDAWTRMQQEGRVRSDLRPAGVPTDALFALVEHELHMNEVDYSIWIALGTDSPAYVVTHDGVPIVSVYRRP